MSTTETIPHEAPTRDQSSSDGRDESAEGKFRTCVDGRILLVNPAFAALAGYASPEALLAAVDEVADLYADGRDRARLIADLVRDEAVTDRQLQLRRRDGSTAWVSVTARLVGQGDDATIEGVVIDISERKDEQLQLAAALEATARREAMLEAVSRNAELLLGPAPWETSVPRVLANIAEAAGASRVSLFVNQVDERGSTIATRHVRWAVPGLVDPLANHPAMAFLDYEAVGIGEWMDILAGDRCVAGLTSEFAEGPRTFLEMLGVHSLGIAPVLVDGVWWGALVFDVMNEARPWSRAEIDVLHTTARMLGTTVERDRVQEVRGQLAAIVETSLDAVLTRAPDGTILTWNGGAERMYGYTPAEAVGRHISLVIPPDHPEDLDNVMGAASAGQTIQGYETERVRADGSRLHASITAAPVLDSAGTVTAVASIERDVTQEVEARRDLARSNAELEQFAYVASHDLQEPLRMVTSFVQLLDRRYGEELDETAKGYIHYAVDGATRMQQLINDLLAFSRVATRVRPFAPVDLTETTRQVLDDLAAAIADVGAHIEVTDLPVVEGDESQLRQVMQNLVANALKFREVGHAPTVRIFAEPSEDGTWRISVADDGIGIDPAHADRVFMIFKRLHTREEYAGTGLGLAISRKIVERHRGRLTFESEPGVGTTFHLTLPQTA